MQRFTDLAVWRESHAFVLDVYRITRLFPPEERYGLTSQLRRASSGVAANIAEGSKRKSPLDYARILNIAEGSLAEADYFLILSRDLEYLTNEDYDRLQTQVARIAGMLHRLRLRIERS